MNKRIEQMIRDIRLQAFAVNSSYSDEVLSLYLNEAQNEIRKVIFISNNECNILKEVHNIDIVGGTSEYDLPARVFAENSIDSVKGYYNGLSVDNPFMSLFPVSIRNYNKVWGYTVINKQIWVSTIDSASSFDHLQIVYSAELPTLALRSGTISSVTATEITLAAGFDEDLALKSDYITIVDADNSQIQTDLKIENFDTLTGVIQVASTTDIVAGQYVLSGEFATNITKLPYACYDYLKKYVERRIAKEDGSKDFNSADLFTTEEKSNIASVFAESSKDISVPEISPYSITI